MSPADREHVAWAVIIALIVLCRMCSNLGRIADNLERPAVTAKAKP